MRGRASVACSFADAIVSTQIVERAFESAREKCTWLPLAAPSRQVSQARVEIR